MALTVQISPPAAGKVTQTTAFSWHGPGDGQDHTFTVGKRTQAVALGGSDYDYDYNFLMLTAIANRGYVFDHFEQRTRIEMMFPGLDEPYVTFDDTSSRENPECLLPTSGSIAFTESSGYSTSPNPEKNWMKFWTESVVAVFVPVPTNPGLIYSPSRDKLIYDQTSGRLLYYP